MSDETPDILSAIGTPLPLEPELDEARKELVRLINLVTGGRDGSVDTAVPGLFVYCVSKPDGPKHAMQTPALGLIAQGSKRIMVGDDIYVYDPMHYLVTSVDLPVCGQVRVTSEQEPYLGQIGLMGAKARQDGQMVEAAKIFLGGSMGAHPRLAQLHHKGVPLERLTDALESLLVEHFGAKRRPPSR
jgi:hypothetical protein